MISPHILGKTAPRNHVIDQANNQQEQKTVLMRALQAQADAYAHSCQYLYMQMASMSRSKEEADHFRNLASAAESIKRMSDAKAPVTSNQSLPQDVNADVVRSIIEANCKEAENQMRRYAGEKLPQLFKFTDDDHSANRKSRPQAFTVMNASKCDPILNDYNKKCV